MEHIKVCPPNQGLFAFCLWGFLVANALSVLGAKAVFAAQAQYDRPPEGLARGKWPAPLWFIAAFGALIVLSAFIYLFVRVRRALRGKG